MVKPTQTAATTIHLAQVKRFKDTFPFNFPNLEEAWFPLY